MIECTLSFEGGSSNSTRSELLVLAKPTVTINPLTLTVEETKSFLITCRASVPGSNQTQGVKFTWYKRTVDSGEDTEIKGDSKMGKSYQYRTCVDRSLDNLLVIAIIMVITKWLSSENRNEK